MASDTAMIETSASKAPPKLNCRSVAYAVPLWRSKSHMKRPLTRPLLCEPKPKVQPASNFGAPVRPPRSGKRSC